MLELVTDQLLTCNKINYNNLENVLSQLYLKKINYADIYFQSIVNESWKLEKKIVKEGSYFLDEGIGVRVISGTSTGFSFSDIITLNELNKNIMIVQDVFPEFRNKNSKKLFKVKNNLIYESTNPLNMFSLQEKIDILFTIDKIARSYDNRVTEVYATLNGKYEQILIASTDGILAADVRPLVQVSINVIVEQNSKIESGHSGGGGRTGYNFFTTKNNLGSILIEQITQEAVRTALVNLSAKEAPSGLLPVVLGPGWPGVLLHEAVGHGLEGDFNRKGTSIFSNKIGNKVASNLCTVVDDGTITARRGSLNIDDEGTPTQYNVLIEKGILKSYLQDKFNANLMNTTSTGNARRESYSHLPMPRMTNTYMLPGINNPKEIIESVDRGLYASNFSGGQVDITSGNFVFSTSEAYLIKNGKITYPVKNAMLIGSGIDVMNNISMVGNDLLLDNGIGICVKEGQSIPVGVGQPTIKIDCLTVGGTS
ncbi:metalloprotease [Buchnera aphidicola (Nipponaphis monzeni)]|uniref:Metalloprotease n=2 Tax=Buchnera aphidicola TaxID=9 RepID=A0A455TAG1_9GAMM|nr:metalloprotease [Buchnera aphidicola (Nipponaphis monzeni)]